MRTTSLGTPGAICAPCASAHIIAFHAFLFFALAYRDTPPHLFRLSRIYTFLFAAENAFTRVEGALATALLKATTWWKNTLRLASSRLAALYRASASVHWRYANIVCVIASSAYSPRRICIPHHAHMGHHAAIAS